MMTKTAIKFSTFPKTYAGLVSELGVPRILHTRAEFDEADEIVSAMAGHDLTPDQADYFALLADLVDRYDREHHAPTATRPTTPVEVLKHLVSQSGMTASDLGMLLGNDRGLGSRLLNGQRELSKAHIRILVAKFHLSAELFF